MQLSEKLALTGYGYIDSGARFENGNAKMPSYRVLADNLGVSRPRICQLVKLGLPTHSIQAALRWRESRPPMRAATNGKAGNWVVPLADLRRRKRRTPSDTGNSLQDALATSIFANNAAFELFEEAKARGDEDGRLGYYMRIYLSTTMTRMKAERMGREEMERRKVLVNRHYIVECCRRCLEAVIRRLRRLPDETGPQCNPQNPVMGYEVLKRAVDAVLEAGQNALRDLSS